MDLYTHLHVPKGQAKCSDSSPLKLLQTIVTC